MRGSAVTLASALGSLDDWKPDLVVVTDMVDLAQFRFFAREILGDIPCVLYFHESQMTYPSVPGEDLDLSYPMTNWTSALAADVVLFNSDYHLEVFFEALPRLLKNFPDLTHEHLIDEVASRSSVLPVGVDLDWIGKGTPGEGPPRVLWNHRWEHDKDPDTFVGAVETLIQSGTDFELVLLGWRPPQTPTALSRLREIAGERIIHDQEVSIESYRKLISSCDIVVSTALQEFFGVSVVEAVAAGCRPVLPNRLSYPWLIEEQWHTDVLYESDGLVDAMRAAVTDPVPAPGLSESMKRFSWTHMGPVYDQRFASIAVDGPGKSAGYHQYSS
jgi:glycosyltransferase involved in cell wall biosynthesis